MRNAFILFTGDRRREEAAKSLPGGTLARIQQRTLRALTKVGDARIFVAGSRLAGATRLSLPASSLGDLVSRATDELFGRGFDRVVLLAGDVAGIRTEMLREVVERLDCKTPRSVIGRSGDGGFYLAAFNAKPEFDWSSIGWFGSTASDDLERLAVAHGFDVSFIESLDDIDHRSDLERLARTSAMPAVRAFLRSLLFERTSEHRDGAIPAPAPVARTAPRAPPAFDLL